MSMEFYDEYRILWWSFPCTGICTVIYNGSLFFYNLCNKNYSLYDEYGILKQNAWTRPQLSGYIPPNTLIAVGYIYTYIYIYIHTMNSCPREGFICWMYVRVYVFRPPTSKHCDAPRCVKYLPAWHCSVHNKKGPSTSCSQYSACMCACIYVCKNVCGIWNSACYLQWSVWCMYITPKDSPRCVCMYVQNLGHLQYSHQVIFICTTENTLIGGRVDCTWA